MPKLSAVKIWQYEKCFRKTCVLPTKVRLHLANNMFPHVWGIVSPDYQILGLEL